MEQPTDPMAAIGKLAKHLGVSHINTLDGCWEHRIDDQWWIALNGHEEPIACSHGATVLPFHAYIEFNGWPAGIVSAIGEGEFAAGSEANPETFTEAINAAIAA